MYDIIVIGSGIAGLYTALLLTPLGRVLVLTKSSLEETNTKYAQGGIAAAIGAGDSPELHYEDTLRAGAGLCDPEAVRVLTTEAPDRIKDLIDFGVPFDTQEGEIALAREGAHSQPRVLHAGGDATGANIERTLADRARASGADIREHFLVEAIEVDERGVSGVRGLNLATSSEHRFPARAVVVASGGAGQLFRITTNPAVATGDGVALAFGAGAELADLEFFQFHPTALALPGVPTFLISEAVRGEGGILRNDRGERFMERYDSRLELASRDVVARAIVREMAERGTDHVLLDVTHMPAAVIVARFPSIYRYCRAHGLDITRERIPVAPAAHYFMGGIRTNAWGETNVPRLFACGECASTGVHGANRLASNSLLEVLVFAKRIVQRLRGEAVGAAVPPSDGLPNPPLRATLAPAPTTDYRVPYPTLTDVRGLLWKQAGIFRERRGLLEARAQLAAWHGRLAHPRDRADYEIANMVLLGRLLVEAALLREESRGAHFRADFPTERPEWRRHILFRAGPAPEAA
jgi:L-aspartate oxidase